MASELPTVDTSGVVQTDLVGQDLPVQQTQPLESQRVKREIQSLTRRALQPASGRDPFGRLSSSGRGRRSLTGRARFQPMASFTEEQEDAWKTDYKKKLEEKTAIQGHLVGADDETYAAAVKALSGIEGDAPDLDKIYPNIEIVTEYVGLQPRRFELAMCVIMKNHSHHDFALKFESGDTEVIALYKAEGRKFTFVGHSDWAVEMPAEEDIEASAVATAEVKSKIDQDVDLAEAFINFSNDNFWGSPAPVNLEIFVEKRIEQYPGRDERYVAVGQLFNRIQAAYLAGQDPKPLFEELTTADPVFEAYFDGFEGTDFLFFEQFKLALVAMMNRWNLPSYSTLLKLPKPMLTMLLEHHEYAQDYAAKLGFEPRSRDDDVLYGDEATLHHIREMLNDNTYYLRNVRATLSENAAAFFDSLFIESVDAKGYATMVSNERLLQLFAEYTNRVLHNEKQLLTLVGEDLPKRKEMLQKALAGVENPQARAVQAQKPILREARSAGSGQSITYFDGVQRERRAPEENNLGEIGSFDSYMIYDPIMEAFSSGSPALVMENDDFQALIFRRAKTDSYALVSPDGNEIIYAKRDQLSEFFDELPVSIFTLSTFDRLPESWESSLGTVNVESIYTNWIRSNYRRV